MKKIKKKRFTVELSEGLYDYVKEISELMYMSEDEFIQQLVEEDIKRDISKTSGTSFDFDDLIYPSSEKKSTSQFCNKPGYESCPFVNSFSSEDVDF